jgi:hypothetical protein
MESTKITNANDIIHIMANLELCLDKYIECVGSLFDKNVSNSLDFNKLKQCLMDDLSVYLQVILPLQQRNLQNIGDCFNTLEFIEADEDILESEKFFTPYFYKIANNFEAIAKLHKMALEYAENRVILIKNILDKISEGSNELKEKSISAEKNAAEILKECNSTMNMVYSFFSINNAKKSMDNYYMQVSSAKKLKLESEEILNILSIIKIDLVETIKAYFDETSKLQRAFMVIAFKDKFNNEHFQKLKNMAKEIKNAANSCSATFEVTKGIVLGFIKILGKKKSEKMELVSGIEAVIEKSPLKVLLEVVSPLLKLFSNI